VDRPIDPVRLSFYHYDWAVQDVASYAAQVMLDEGISDSSRAYALRIVSPVFGPGSEIDRVKTLDPDRNR
jgi:hypothetical protein